MIEQVTKYETSDGKLFDSEKEAQEHDIDRAREFFYKRTQFLIDNGNMSASQQFDMILKMLPDYQSAIALSNALTKILF